MSDHFHQSKSQDSLNAVMFFLLHLFFLPTAKQKKNSKRYMMPTNIIQIYTLLKKSKSVRH